MQPAAAALLALIPLRLLNAWLAGVADCDETYNYWEAVCLLAAPHPVRRPLQTWEYAPEFALRSWAYVLPYAAISRIVDNSFLAVRLCCAPITPLIQCDVRWSHIPLSMHLWQSQMVSRARGEGGS